MYYVVMHKTSHLLSSTQTISKAFQQIKTQFLCWTWDLKIGCNTGKEYGMIYQEHRINQGQTSKGGVLMSKDYRGTRAQEWINERLGGTSKNVWVKCKDKGK